METTTPAQTSAPSLPDLSTTPANAQEAQAALDTLRNERVAGRVDQSHYLERAEYLQRVIAGEQIAATNPYPTIEERLSQQYDEAMKAPEDIAGYNFGPIPGAESTEAALAAHTAIATAFKAAGIPAIYGKTILNEATRLGNYETVKDAQLQIDRVQGQLRERWGTEFEARLARVDELLDAMADADPMVEEILESRPWLVAGSLMSMDLLDRIAQYRAGRR